MKRTEGDEDGREKYEWMNLKKQIKKSRWWNIIWWSKGETKSERNERRERGKENIEWDVEKKRGKEKWIC